MNVHRPLIKICGVRDPRHVEVAAEAGADLIGLVFYPGSHRFIDGTLAREIAQEARTNGLQSVGLFVNQEAETLLQARAKIGFDIIQLGGTEEITLLDEIDGPLIPTVRASGDLDQEARERFNALAERNPWAIIVDAAVPGAYGGTGELSNWNVAKEFAKQHRVLLAGGLTPANVNAAIEKVEPFAVDVSTGVETNKTKDISKIRAFVANARGVGLATDTKESRS